MSDSPPRIMVVDDDLGMRLTLEGILDEEGYQVIGAADGYQAIELAKKMECSLIFMDVKMPGISGVETYREIKKVRPGAVVIMMTGYSVEALVKEALEEGAYAVIYKPFEMEQVISILKDALKTTSVLVVDDRVADRVTMRVILEDRGYHVCEAGTGAEAISMAAARHYDVILMDIRMPGMDGCSAFEEIRRTDPKAKAIFVTGYELEGPVREALLRGAYSVVTKPVDPEGMLALMGSITSPQGCGDE